MWHWPITWRVEALLGKFPPFSLSLSFFAVISAMPIVSIVFAISLLAYFRLGSRVHITKTTLDYLGDKFEVEPGGGAAREAYLADHKVETYLIIPPKVSAPVKKRKKENKTLSKRVAYTTAWRSDVSIKFNANCERTASSREQVAQNCPKKHGSFFECCCMRTEMAKDICPHGIEWYETHKRNTNLLVHANAQHFAIVCVAMLQPAPHSWQRSRTHRATHTDTAIRAFIHYVFEKTF